MTYTSNIPVSGNTLGGTRDLVRGNFQQIDTVTAINHVAFNQSGQGKHKFLQMPEQVSAPATLANEAGFYCKQATNPAEANLYFRAEDSGGTGGFEYQMTRADETNTATFATNTAYAANHLGGWTFLPGGMILQYGFRSSVAASGLTTVTFPIQFTTGCYSVIITGITTGDPSKQIMINATVATLSNFVINNQSSTYNKIYWQAIGI